MLMSCTSVGVWGGLVILLIPFENKGGVKTPPLMVSNALTRYNQTPPDAHTCTRHKHLLILLGVYINVYSWQLYGKVRQKPVVFLAVMVPTAY